MDFLRQLMASLSSEKKGTGALREAVDDYRNISLGSFQKPVGASELKDVRGMEDLIRDFLFWFDQKTTGSCVMQAITKLLMLYIFRKTGEKVILSPRFGYKLCKMKDGIPSVSGTYPRIGALVAVNDGFLRRTDLADNPEAGEKEYLNFEVTEAMRSKAKELTMPGFAFVDPTIEAIKEAIHQNGAVVGAAIVKKWSVLPLLGKGGTSSHYTIWYRVEDFKDDFKIYIDNSWGGDWLSKVKNWLFPGRGYFLWSEYKQGLVFDIIAFTDIPVDILTRAKAKPFKFTKDLKVGMTDPEVKELQKFLNGEGFNVALSGAGSKGQETSYFGNLTKEALILWQRSKGIPFTGYFGTLSRNEANKRVPKVTLEEAIIEVESGGNDNAIGDKHLTHKAYGAMQIRQPAVDDVNKRLKTDYKAQDCLGNRELSLKIFRTYCEIYQPNGSDEQKARLWNGGMGGIYYPSRTDGYWAKVKKLLQA